MPTHGSFDVEISLAKGIIFTKIGLANGAILKLWAAHPYPKFSWEPLPPPGGNNAPKIDEKFSKLSWSLSKVMALNVAN